MSIIYNNNIQFMEILFCFVFVIKYIHNPHHRSMYIPGISTIYIIIIIQKQIKAKKLITRLPKTPIAMALPIVIFVRSTDKTTRITIPKISFPKSKCF